MLQNRGTQPLARGPVSFTCGVPYGSGNLAKGEKWNCQISRPIGSPGPCILDLAPDSSIQGWVGLALGPWTLFGQDGVGQTPSMWDRAGAALGHSPGLQGVKVESYSCSAYIWLGLTRPQLFHLILVRQGNGEPKIPPLQVS